MVIPSLLFDLHEGSAKSAKQRDIVLSILNRMGKYLLREQETLRLLAAMLQSAPSLDKRFIISTLRCCGQLGEQCLLDILREKSSLLSEGLVCYILAALAWRVDPRQTNLRIRSIEYSLESCFLPGNLYQYEGSIEPFGFPQDQRQADNFNADSLCLNSRDFLATLQRYLLNRMLS